MGIEKADLGNRGCSYESGVFVELRTGFHTTAAGDAARKRVGCFLLFGSQSRTRSEIVAAIDGNPGFHRLQVFEQDAAIDCEIADHRELGEWLQADGLVELVHQR